MRGLAAAAFIFLGVRLATAAAPQGAATPADVDVLRAVCGGREYSRQKGHWFCHGCPEDTTSRDQKSAFRFYGDIAGSFSGDARQSLAVFRGCEPHSSAFGGAVLLEKAGNVWRKVRYYPGLVFDADRCLAFTAKNGRTALACLADNEGGGASMEWIESIRFDGLELKMEPATPVLYTNVGGVDPCARDVLWTKTTHRRDLDRAGDGFIVEIEAQKTRPIAGQACDQTSRAALPLSREKKSFRLRYRFDGDRFGIDPASRDELEAVREFEHP